ncbi:MAG: PH domain-containing protein [Candidatus Aminicenantes bacterium]|nr:PH domain-containing protein [Candidatus Aminicenantes bacterium]MDH5385566.1 PH domain-containing protein [Candidatus Aminicenantes bacterium]
MVLFEDSTKYELWTKVLLVFPVVLLIAMGAFFYNYAHHKDAIPSEVETSFHASSIALFATAPFILIVYWLVLPTKIYILQDRIRIKYGRFDWNIRFDTIESVKPAKGIPPLWSNSSVTSYRNQIEIVRIGRMNVRLSPSHRDQFVDHANRALSDWKRIQST